MTLGNLHVQLLDGMALNGLSGRLDSILTGGFLRLLPNPRPPLLRRLPNHVSSRRSSPQKLKSRGSSFRELKGCQPDTSENKKPPRLSRDGGPNYSGIN